jgi:branched-chain amino acid transport system ATP-binding protein
MAAPALHVEDLTVYYGPVRGVEGVNLELAGDEIVALLGANGAGKSTVLKAISGLVKARSGKVHLFGEELGSLRPHQRVGKGVVQVPEGRHILGTLSVRDNLLLGTYSQRGGGRTRSASVDEVLELFPLLRPHVGKLAGMLSGGEQQILALARGVLSKPRLLMVDEPSLGLAPQMVDIVYDQLRAIVDHGTPVLLVEQNVTLALEAASRAYVLAQGSVALDGRAEDLADDDRVTAAYLGTSPREAADPAAAPPA